MTYMYMYSKVIPGNSMYTFMDINASMINDFCTPFIIHVIFVCFFLTTRSTFLWFVIIFKSRIKNATYARNKNKEI